MGHGNNKSWLDDDPEWDVLRQRIEKNPAQIPENTSKEPKNKQLQWNISLPKLNRKKIGVGIAAFSIIGLSLVVSKNLPSLLKKKPTNAGVLSDVAQEPQFDTVLPDGKKEETSSGKIGYDAERRVASFTDMIGTANITVSQQELPEAFKANPDEEVKKVAEGFSATEIINESNPKAYLGNDVAGPQTVIFHKKGLLVFIFSTKPIEKDQWAEYITKLL